MVLRTDCRARVPPGAAPRLRLVGRARRGPVRRDPLVHLGRDRDDREPLLPGHCVGHLRDCTGAGAPECAPSACPAHCHRGRLPHTAAVRNPVRDVDRSARRPLADRSVDQTPHAARHRPLLADCRAARGRRRRLRRAARRGRGRVGLVRRIRGPLARLRPARGREVVRLPPRRFRRLPRDRSRRGRADRALEARSGRTSRFALRGRLRRALRRSKRHRAPRRCRVREQSLGLRPAPRPLRVLPPPSVADRLRRLARLRPATSAPRDRDRRRPGPRAAADPAVRAARERSRDRHRPRSAVGAGPGADGGPRPCVRHPRARDLRGGTARRDPLPPPTHRPDRTPRRRRRHPRR